MGSSIQTWAQQCTRLSSPLPSWPLQLLTLQLQLTPPPQPMLQLPPTTNPPHTRRRSSPLSHLPTSTELLMTTARPTSRNPRPRTETESSLMSHTREPQSTHQSQRRDTDTPQPMLPQPQLTSQLVLKLVEVKD